MIDGTLNEVTGFFTVLSAKNILVSLVPDFY